MGKVIKQVGKETELDLNWAVERAQESYNLLFGYFDEMVKPHTVNEKIAISDNCKELTNSLVKSLKLATVLSSEEAVLNSVFGDFDVEIVEKANTVDLSEYREKQKTTEN